jgi:hypothetical protein
MRTFTLYNKLALVSISTFKFIKQLLNFYWELFTKNKQLFKIKNKTDVIAGFYEAIFRFLFSVYVHIETKLKIATAFF